MILAPTLSTLLSRCPITPQSVRVVARAIAPYVTSNFFALASRKKWPISTRPFATTAATTTTKDSSYQNFDKTKVCLIGSGNWGSAISKIVGNNCAVLSFCEEQVNMYVHDEMITQRDRTTAATTTTKLSSIINQRHENVKYLPDIRLPENVVAIPDLAEACQGANLLLFVVPHQFLLPILPVVKENMPDTARGVSLIKGLEYDATTHRPVQISHVIETTLGGNFRCGALMGANLAKEVARGQFSESTLACDFGDDALNEATRLVFHADNFRVQHCKDVAAAEVCGALKNVVALGAGFIDGLDFGGNTKAALLRVGLLEIMDFAQLFFQGVVPSTFLESCGVADLIATCYGGRNRKCAEAFARQSTPEQTSKDCVTLWTNIEQDVLKGQKLQGTLAVQDLYQVLLYHNLLERFPLFSSIYSIAFQGRPVIDILSSIYPVEHNEGLVLGDMA